MLMLSDFYGAFASASFALLGLWLVVVQIRIGEWRGSEFHVRQSYGIALHFVLPGVMSVAALIDPFDPAFWRISFAIVALGGAVILIMVRDRSGGRSAPRPAPRTRSPSSCTWRSRRWPGPAGPWRCGPRPSC